MGHTANHTPGPWKLAKINDENGHLTHFVTNDDDSIITYALPRTFADEELMANARLLAAAPELLEVCKGIAKLAEGQGHWNMLEIAGFAKTAIAKAEGN